MLGFLNTSWCLRRRFPGSGEERGDSAEVDDTAVEDDDGVIILDGRRETTLSHFSDGAKNHAFRSRGRIHSLPYIDVWIA